MESAVSRYFQHYGLCHILTMEMLSSAIPGCFGILTATDDEIIVIQRMLHILSSWYTVPVTVVVNENVEEQTCFHNVDIKDFIKNNKYENLCKYTQGQLWTDMFEFSIRKHT